MSNHINFHIRCGTDEISIRRFNSLIEDFFDHFPKYKQRFSEYEFWPGSVMLGTELRSNYQEHFDPERGELYFEYCGYRDATRYGNIAECLSRIAPDIDIHYFAEGDGYMPYECAHWIFRNGSYTGGWANNDREGMAILEQFRGEEPRCSVCDLFDACLPEAKWDEALNMCDPDYDPENDPYRKEYGPADDEGDADIEEASHEEVDP